MRKLLLTAVLLVAGGPAFASSIEVVGSAAPKNTSIVVMKCTNCPAPKVAEDAKAYKVPQVAPGSQAAEIIEVDGEKKLKRAEAWLGGSPVVFISSAEGWSTDGTRIAASATLPDDGIDVDATTAAVSSTGAAAPIAASMGGATSPKALDVSTYELRLN
ncbi:plant virulence effector HPE1-like domain-containing protein [Rhizobium sp. CAU 1783]